MTSRRRDALVLLGILALAAVLRLPGLGLRGQWDADQGDEMLVLLHLVRDGQVPLLGPPTFTGSFHHGALYYGLLAPAAFLGDADPGAVTLLIAALGIATVGVLWALGRELGGAWAGHVTGVLAAVSPALVMGSTFIWNPNLVPLGAGLALLGAVRAWRTRRAAWWLLPALGTMIAMQVHVSGGILLPPLVVAFVADARRGGGEGAGRRATAGVAIAACLVLAAGYLPLLAHELGTGFSDTQGLIGYLGAGAGTTQDLGARILVVTLRSIAWPFVGLITEAPMLAAAVALGALGLSAMALLLAGRDERAGLWLLAGVFLWSLPVLAVTAPTLMTSVPGLPNDHYHTFLDPVVIALAGAGIAALSRGGARAGLAVAGRVAGAAALAALVVVSVARWPAAASPDGGWPLADAAAGRVQATLQTLTTRTRLDTALVSIPDFKSADAIRFPLVRRGVDVWIPGAPEFRVVDQLVLVCDPLFEDVVGQRCGGAAEGTWLGAEERPWRLVDRFEAGPRRVVSEYAIGDQQ